MRKKKYNYTPSLFCPFQLVPLDYINNKKIKTFTTVSNSNILSDIQDIKEGTVRCFLEKKTPWKTCISSFWKTCILSFHGPQNPQGSPLTNNSSLIILDEKFKNIIPSNSHLTKSQFHKITIIKKVFVKSSPKYTLTLVDTKLKTGNWKLYIATIINKFN